MVSTVPRIPTAGEPDKAAEARRFPRPWNAVELEESFRVEDASGFPVAYVLARIGDAC